MILIISLTDYFKFHPVYPLNGQYLLVRIFLMVYICNEISDQIHYPDEKVYPFFDLFTNLFSFYGSGIKP